MAERGRLLGQRARILLRPKEWRQEALRTIVDRTHKEIQKDKSNGRKAPEAGQPDTTSRMVNGKAIWFTAAEPSGTATINGGNLIRHRTFTIREQDGQLTAEVKNDRRFGIIPKIVFVRRLYHAFSGEMEEPDAIAA